MAFGRGTKPATMVKTPKVVQTSHKGPPLSLPKPKLSGAKGRGSMNGCCGK